MASPIPPPPCLINSLFSLAFMKESIVDEQESNKDENIHLRRFLRVLANVLITCCLCGSGYLIYFVVKRSQTFSKMQNVGWYERNEVRKRRSCWFLLFDNSDIYKLPAWIKLKSVYSTPTFGF